MRVVIFLVVILAVPLLAGYYFFNGEAKKAAINSFDKCVEAGYPVMESFPEQCSVPGVGTFVNSNEIQDADKTDEQLKAEYVGLKESDARILAGLNNRKFRVVSLEGNRLAATTDLIEGRINASLAGGKVTDITIEHF